jgi:hypothetical protein
VRQLLIALLFCVSSTSSIGWAQLGEARQSNQETQDQAMEGLGAYTAQMVEQRHLELKSAEDLLDRFISGEDKHTYQSFLNALAPADRVLAPVRRVGEELVVRLGPYTLSAPLMNMFSPEIKINGKSFLLLTDKTYTENMKALETFLDKEILTSKKSALFSGFGISKAHANEVSEAERARFKNILMLNSSGVIYLTVSTMSFWRDDLGALRELLARVKGDLEDTERSCNELRNQVGVSGGSIPVYKMLNAATAETLRSLTVNDQIDSRTLMRNAFARYAHRKNHREEELSFTRCEDFLNNFLTRLNRDLQLQVMGFCDQFRITESCLSDLKSRHDRVVDQSRDGSLRMYNGRRTDQNNNALPYISNPSGTRR